MIQRIQTLWLFLASLTLFLLFVFPYAHFSDSIGIGYALKITGLYKVVAGQDFVANSFILQPIVLVVLALIPFLIIFNYKNRKKQRQLTYGTLLLTLIFGCWLYFSTKNAVEAIQQQIGIGNVAIGSLLVPICIIFLFLAQKGIQNDEKLIKSAERLR